MKPQYISARIGVSDIVQFVVSQPEGILNAIRENQFIAESNKEENLKTNEIPKVDVQFSHADELIQNDRIVFSQTLGTFTIKGTGDTPRVVTLFPENCSCSVKECYHILAVKISLGMEIKQKVT